MSPHQKSQSGRLLRPGLGLKRKFLFLHFQHHKNICKNKVKTRFPKTKTKIVLKNFRGLLYSILKNIAQKISVEISN
jgi:hypothetical protein